MLISETYRDLNEELHDTNASYGTSGKRHAETVAELANMLKSTNVLDYGCGKGTLNDALGFRIKEYDPCIEGKDDEPDLADLVVCTDVLEHVEPDCIDDVLNHIEELALQAVFLTVATQPAKKFLSDGRNAHICLEQADWWLPKLMKRWKLVTFQDSGGEFQVILEA
jgi:2-polyprenyl-3-methyl-5-hydroxy-6-metoxy-1,4-benzoquinol methylase